MMCRWPALALAASLFLQSALAGDGVDRHMKVTGDLTVERAVQIALQQNPQILQAVQEIERTRGQVIEVRASALPRVAINANYNQQDKRLLEGASGARGGGAAQSLDPRSGAAPVNGGGSGSGSGDGTGANGPDDGSGENPQNGGDNGSADLLAALLDQDGGGSGGSNGGGDKSYRVALEVRQVLYAGGQVSGALKIAKFTQDSSYYNLRDTIDRVIAQVRTQFNAILLNRALITVQEESVGLAESQLKDQVNRFDAGTVPRFNVLRAEVAVANALPELIRARNDYLIAQLRLAKMLGLPPGPAGKPSFNVVGQLSVRNRPLGVSNALQVARERRPFLKVQRLNILIETEQIQIALAGYKPRLDANAGYELRNSNLSDDLADTVNGWFFGVTGRWDIFDGFATLGRTKQARARLESAKVNYDDSVRQVELEVQQAYANLQQARQTIDSQRKTVEQALEAVRLVGERLSVGAGTQLEVLDARLALTRARTTELQARADYNTALAEFDRVTATDTVYDDTFVDPLSKPPRKSSRPSKPAAVKMKR